MNFNFWRLNFEPYKIVVSIALLCICVCCKKSIIPDNTANPSPELSPEQELKTFQTEPGLKIQLVAAEPMIQDPVVMTFDENGRLWVVEMRGFMPDIDGTGEKERVGRVSVLQDTNGDGQMDSAHVYIDSLILPRAMALIPHGALIVENASLWVTQDVDGDLRADSKTLIDSTYAGNLLPEHSGNGLWRGLDNWYYNAKSKLRYRRINDQWIRDTTEFRGQWGICHDDEGRLYYNYNWSQLHGDLVPPNYFGRNKNHKTTSGLDQGLTLDRRIYPIRPTPAVNRGYIPGTLNEEGRLLEFTAACSPFYYRGKTLPPSYYGNVFVCEPSGNLIKRNQTIDSGLSLSAFDPNPGREFMASTDERFRPVFIASGPDGALYVTDMYRGLIQHGAYVTPYLREQTIKRNLVLPVHRGRIWKIVPEDFKPKEIPKLSMLTSSQLIPFLSHANGWYRDMAQRLIVERKDKSVLNDLNRIAKSDSFPLGQLHALWTLEGLDALSPDLLFTLLTDDDALIRAHSIRLLEGLSKHDLTVRRRLGIALKQSWSNSSDKEQLQIALSAGILNKKDAFPILAGIIQSRDTSALMRDAVMSSLYHHEYDFLVVLMDSPWKMSSSPAKEIFLEMLATAILRNGITKELSGMLALLEAQSPLAWYTKTILTGLAIQGIDGRFKPIRLATAPPILIQSNLSFDSIRLNLVKNMFEWPGHTVNPAIRSNLSTNASIDPNQFATGRQNYLSSCSGCHGADGAGVTRFAPTLIGSDWVAGNEKRLALLVLHGIEGPIDVNGKKYDAPEILPVMPSHATMDDSKIAAILTYIRNEWGNQAAPVTGRLVSGARILTQGRVMPWTAYELNKHIQDSLPAH